MLEVLLNLLLSIVGELASALIIMAVAPEDRETPEHKPEDRHYRR